MLALVIRLLCLCIELKQNCPLILLLAPLAILLHKNLLTRLLIWLNKLVKWCARHNIEKLLWLALPYSSLFSWWLDLVIHSKSIQQLMLISSSQLLYHPRLGLGQQGHPGHNIHDKLDLLLHLSQRMSMRLSVSSGCAYSGVSAST